MKTGRNDPCPCGSGKKYKKCCLANDEEESRRAAMVQPAEQPHPMASGPTAEARQDAPTPPRPRDPVTERADRRWEEFEAQEGDGRIAMFLETLEDAEVIGAGDMAFEMLNLIHTDAEKSGSRTRFAECVEALRQRRPEVFAEAAPFYLRWCVVDALVEGRQELVPSLSRELAQTAGRDIDVFNRTVEALGYHGQLDVLVEALRIAWPRVKSSDNVVPWGVSEFAGSGADHEIFQYVQTTGTPDPTDPALLDRIRFYVEEPRMEYLREFIDDLAGKSERQWGTEDFAFRPRRKRRDEDWDEESDELQEEDPGARNLNRLIIEFVGYLRRELGISFARGELARQELYRYFRERSEGNLNPRPSMMEQMMGSKRKLPKPPRPAHPLCPERVTLDAYLARLLGMMSGGYHSAAALFQAIPAWLRFLESRRLIDAETSRKVTAELRPLHETILEILQQYTEDPHVYRQAQVWPQSISAGA